jgi:hypothetical protein
VTRNNNNNNNNYDVQIPEDNSEHHTGRRENLKSHTIIMIIIMSGFLHFGFLTLYIFDVGWGVSPLQQPPTWRVVKVSFF